jgi:23S rRNA (guanosine2251-2'-O)-methyltransferase
MPKIIFGLNPIIEALKSDRPPEKVFILHGTHGPGIRDILNMAISHKIPIEQVGKLRFTQLGGDNRTQRVAALISEFDYCEVPNILENAILKKQPAFLALLSNIEDPRNFGAIIRSAECAGVHGLVIPKHRAVGITETVAASSAGAMSHVAITKVTNLITTIDELKAAGVWIVGADQSADKTIYEVDLTGPVGIVVGGESKGIRRLLKERCDFVVRIPMRGKVNSLNASVAAAIVFFEVVRQREEAEKSAKLLVKQSEEPPSDRNQFIPVAKSAPTVTPEVIVEEMKPVKRRKKKVDVTREDTEKAEDKTISE